MRFGSRVQCGSDVSLIMDCGFFYYFVLNIGLLVDYMALDRVEYVFEFVNMNLFHRKIPQGCLKVLPCRIKLHMVNLIHTMRSLHIFPFIIIGPTCNHTNKLNLTLYLFIYVCIGKVISNSLIFQHNLVELVDYQINSTLTS